MNCEKDRQAPCAPGSGNYRPVVNLFRHKLTPDLLCAVPEDEPVPGFLDAGTWSFAGAAPAEALAGLDADGPGAPSGVPMGRWRTVRRTASTPPKPPRPTPARP